MTSSKNGTAPCEGARANGPSIHPNPIDHLLVMATRALLFPEARALAARLGPDLFPDGAPRFLARSLIVDPAPPVAGLSARRKAELDHLLGEVERATLPDDEAWAVHCIRLLSERQYAPILAGTFRWAASQTERGTPVRWLRLRVTDALDIAEGIRPFDHAATWGERAA